jgi:uncharacterized protein (UPF0335 family)
MADGSNSLSAQDELQAFIERIEQVDAEKAELARTQKEIYAEAKGRGYDTKAMRKLVAERKRDPDDLAEEIAVLDMYREALGMAGVALDTGHDDDTAAMV